MRQQQVIGVRDVIQSLFALVYSPSSALQFSLEINVIYFISLKKIFWLKLLSHYYVTKTLLKYFLCVSSGISVKINELVKSIGPRAKILGLKSHLAAVLPGQAT